ncbi:MULTISPECIES: methylated-DNA--[protein]-cysteine S-methyltransferase [Lactobacillaceae]|uniref:methylated-DNA--[protein]-cysteine S-methyltransferase n=1 Tax=Lactobacillaceae TaxID=33958 RepID=UPI00145718F3|nr:methylated-DNA--[protein]-cysteine S-methyltransferase [Lactobacillus sp. HBUAS51381]NLR08405.1 methylated-DNA--[protein]-cysteine S-methyltransferase [Lactobacillus sp. HBUAS51381]
MIRQKQLVTPLGPVTVASDGVALTGLWFTDQHYYGSTLPAKAPTGELPVFDQVATWLTAYFAGQHPTVTFPVQPTGTALREAVWSVLRTIPYGETVTYRELATRVTPMIGHNPGARAMGNAVGHNPISLVIPCHRVIGQTGDLVGYAGGLTRKKALLTLEGCRFEGSDRVVLEKN